MAGALASVLLLFAMLGGTAYFFCLPMERAQLSCCCHKGASREARGAAAVAPTCCEGHRVSALPPATGASHLGAWVPPPALVALLPLLLTLSPPDEPGEAAVFARGNLARAGPEAPVYARCCTYLI